MNKKSIGAAALPLLQIAIPILAACEESDAATKPDSAASRPNIILIMTDQQSYNTIGALSGTNQGTYSSTPNIDRIVREGVAFTNVYCANPVSVPSRFALFTGKFGGPYDIRENNCRTADEAKVRKLLSTNGMGQVFEKGGYDTYYGGKVHLPFSGESGSSKFACPTGYGFGNCYTKDEREGLGKEAAAIIDEKGSELKAGKPDKPFLMVASFLNPHDICLEGSANVSDELKGEGSEDEKTRLKAACVRAVREKAAAIDSTEFYKRIAPQLPDNYGLTRNYPVDLKNYANLPDYYWRKYRWIYAELVSTVDSQIAPILDALDRNPELKKNTIIVFTADHGEMQGAHRTMTKSLPYDECQRVPMIFSGPGIKAGAKNNTLTCNGIDLLPTLCGLAGIQAPETDGLSLASRITGNDESVLRKVLYLEGDGFFTVLNDNFKYSYFDSKKTGQLLIDRANDKGEMNNVVGSYPEIAAKLKSHIPFDKVKPVAKASNNDAKKATGKKRKK